MRKLIFYCNLLLSTVIFSMEEGIERDPKRQIIEIPAQQKEPHQQKQQRVPSLEFYASQRATNPDVMNQMEFSTFIMTLANGSSKNALNLILNSYFKQPPYMHMPFIKDLIIDLMNKKINLSEIVNAENQNILVWSIINKLQPITEYLINNNIIGINPTDNKNYILLASAAKNNNPIAAEFLLEHGANIEAKSNLGATPLHFAAQNGHSNVANLLLEHGANINAKSNLGASPLHFAAHNGHNNIANLLLEHGANINAKSNLGVTPLHIAVLNNRLDIVKLLLKNGANKNETTNQDKTPLDIAQKKGFTDIINLLSG